MDGFLQKEQRQVLRAACSSKTGARLHKLTCRLIIFKNSPSSCACSSTLLHITYKLLHASLRIHKAPTRPFEFTKLPYTSLRSYLTPRHARTHPSVNGNFSMSSSRVTPSGTLLTEPQKMPVRFCWNNERDSRLLRAILKVHGLKIDYEKVAEEFGEGVTASVISRRVLRIRGHAVAESTSTSAMKREAPDDDEPPPLAKKRSRAAGRGVKWRKKAKIEESESDPEEMWTEQLSDHSTIPADKNEGSDSDSDVIYVEQKQCA